MTHRSEDSSTFVPEEHIKNHFALVKRVAHHMLGRLPKSIQLDDLIQSGMLGLLEATRSYDASKGASFETYANIRIRGHMLDEVRRNDWVPRSVYRHARDIASAVKNIENRMGRDATDQEIAHELNIDLDKYHHMLQDSNGAHVYGFEDLDITDDQLKNDTLEPQLEALRSDMSNLLTQTVKGLPHKERLVLSLYYEHELNLKEIGEILGVSESRVSQLHSQATHRIKSRLPEATL